MRASLASLVLLAGCIGPALPEGEAPSSDRFERDVVPLLEESCGTSACHGAEDAEFAAYLCSDAASCFVGQVFPVCGGWVQR